MRPGYSLASIMFPEVTRNTQFIVNMKYIVAAFSLLGIVCVSQPLQGMLFDTSPLLHNYTSGLMYQGIPQPGGDPSHQQGTLQAGGDPSHQGGSQYPYNQAPQGFVPINGLHVTLPSAGHATPQTQQPTSFAASTTASPATSTVPPITTSNTCAVAKQLCNSHCPGGYLVDPDDCTFCMCKKDIQPSNTIG
ncbi:uncharacterized protein LOC127865594 [Dreissena polymorpha]|uniref:Antistasin-like domain-containing protein n=1 Tax=Dreissena polymorpha TaxID=45954 RepID=A0A9D4LJZ2_DREPO|nr:uncharacterized protein LOC127865594 [Dreissena polymorpha]KAH3860135.1 hypothetical protein DPMN_023026 [Dreissena polymorpha]